RAPRALSQLWEQGPASMCPAPSPTATRDSPCSTRRVSSFGLRRLDARLHFGIARLHAGLFGELDPAQRVLALNDAERSVPSLLFHEGVEVARLVDAIGYMGWERRRHLATPCQAEGELRLLDRGDDALRLGNELGLAQPTRRLRRSDEPVRVL